MFFENRWYNACLATFTISALPIAMLLLIRVDSLKANINSVKLLNVMLCFAAGGLLGDVFLHAIPHLLMPHSHDHGHGHGHAHHEHSHKVVRSVADMVDSFLKELPAHEASCFGSCSGSEAPLGGVETAVPTEHHHEDPHRRALMINLAVLAGFFVFFIADRVAAYNVRRRQRNSTEAAGRTEPAGSFLDMAASGWLNIVADLLHNFTDGIALGVVFSSDSASLAVATTVSVLIHEVPHELGDFAILIDSGLSKTNAIVTQLLTALGALAGTYVGFVAGELAHQSLQEALLAFSCGGFVYLATVIVLARVMEGEGDGDAHGHGHSHSHTHDTAVKQNTTKSGEAETTLAQIFWDSCGFLLGIGLMVLVAELEAHEH